MFHVIEICDGFLCKLRIREHKTIGKLILNESSLPSSYCLFTACYENLSHSEFYCMLENIIILHNVLHPKRHIIILRETTRLSSAFEIYFQNSRNYLRQQNDNLQNIDYIVTTIAKKGYFIVNMFDFRCVFFVDFLASTEILISNIQLFK